VDAVYFPRGVADPGGEAGYVDDGSGIVAVGIQQGEQRWRTERAAYPLISDGKRLAAAGTRERSPNVLEVVVHDGSRGGEVLLVSEPVVLPDWATVGEQGPETVSMRAQLDGHALRLEWTARTRYGGGAPPPQSVAREAARDAAGVVEVDLETGSVEHLTADHGAEPADARRPPLDPDDLDGSWVAGNAVARLVWDAAGDEQVLSLEVVAPDSGDVRARVEVARGSGLVAQVTPDGCYLLVHTEPAPPGESPWWVFSARTGDRVATLTYDAGARWPAILRDRAFYVVEERDAATTRRTLRARELDSGSVAWELQLAARETVARRLRQ
jgi:hypothetical protein